VSSVRLYHSIQSSTWCEAPAVYAVRITQMQSDLLPGDLVNGSTPACVLESQHEWRGEIHITSGLVDRGMRRQVNACMYPAITRIALAHMQYPLLHEHHKLYLRAFSTRAPTNRSASRIGPFGHLNVSSLYLVYISHSGKKFSTHPSLTPLLYSLMYFFNPLSLSLACSNTSSSLQIANRSQSSARCALSSVKNSVGGMAATPSSMMQNHMSLKSRGRSATCGGNG
jgi:hypothetical protein